MRALGRALWVLLLALIIVVLAIFAVDNLRTVTVNFAGQAFTAGLWWVILGCAALGFLLGLLLLEPGRVISGWRARAMQRERDRTQVELGTLRERHAALQAERDTLQAERDHLRTRLTQPARAVSQPAVGSGVAVRGQETQPQQTAILPNVTANAAPGATDGREPTITSETVTRETTADRTPAVSDRLRGFFHHASTPATGGVTSQTTTETETQQREPSTPAV